VKIKDEGRRMKDERKETLSPLPPGEVRVRAA
jgi:hypothetical protein